MVAAAELGLIIPGTQPPIPFPPKDIPLEKRIEIYREQYGIKCPTDVFIDTGKPVREFTTIGAGEWHYRKNPDTRLPFYVGKRNTFDPRFLKALGREQPKFQLPEDGHSEIHARPIHFEEQNWEYLIREAYEVDPGQQKKLPRLTELKLSNGQVIDVLGLGPDGRIFIDDVSCSQNPVSRCDKMVKIRGNYVKQVEEVYRDFFKEDIDPELIVPRVIHFEPNSLTGINTVTVYAYEDFFPYILDDEAEQIEFVA
jgi:hypothetical protein